MKCGGTDVVRNVLDFEHYREGQSVEQSGREGEGSREVAEKKLTRERAACLVRMRSGRVMYGLVSHLISLPSFWFFLPRIARWL